MSLNIVKIKLKRDSSNKNNTTKNIIKSRLSNKEISSNKPLSKLFSKDQKFRFNYITSFKPRLTPLEEIKAKEVRKFIKDIDKFKQDFYEVNKNKYFIKYGKKYFKESSIFYQNYELFKERTKNIFGQKEMLYDLQKKLKQKNIKIPIIEGENKNLFKPNLLLSTNKNIPSFINHHLGTKTSDTKSITYINKINRVLSSKIKGNPNIDMPQINKELSKNLSWVSKYYKDNNDNNTEQKEIEDKNNKYKLNISKSQENLLNIDKEINSLKDLDYSLEVENKNYYNYLKNKNNKNKEIKDNKSFFSNSKIFNKTRWSLPRTSLNKSSNSGSEADDEAIKVNFSNNNIKKVNTSKYDNIMNINRNNSISSINTNKKKAKSNSLKLVNKNNSIDLINMPKPMPIPIPKLKKSKFIKIKKLNLKIKKLESSKSQDLSNLSLSSLHQNNSYDKIYSSKNDQKTPKFKNEINSSDFNEKEKIYNKIKKDNSFEYNNLIQNYLKDRGVNYNYSAFDINDVFYNFKNMRDKIYKNDLIKINIKLKNSCSVGLKSLDKLNNYYRRNNIKMKTMEDEIIKVFTNISSTSDIGNP